MKYKIGKGNKAKRRHKTNLTKGAFGKVKNISENYNESKLKVIPRSKRK